MQPLFRFLQTYHALILLIFLEILSVLLIFKHNEYQRSAFSNALYTGQSVVYAQFRQVGIYFSLKQENARLSEENASLREQLLALSDTTSEDYTLFDTLYLQQYTCMSAKVVQNTTNKQYNYLTLNRGKKDGVEPDMAVIGPEGIVGIVMAVSDHFATVLSVLNRDFSVSAKFQSSQFFGSLTWDGKSPYYATLNDIPLHAPVSIGDTLVCSGYSTMFPEGTRIGTVEGYDKEDGNFYNITVRLSSSFRKLYHVTVIKDLLKKEQTGLETASFEKNI